MMVNRLYFPYIIVRPVRPLIITREWSEWDLGSVHKLPVLLLILPVRQEFWPSSQDSNPDFVVRSHASFPVGRKEDRKARHFFYHKYYNNYYLYLKRICCMCLKETKRKEVSVGRSSLPTIRHCWPQSAKGINKENRQILLRLWGSLGPDNYWRNYIGRILSRFVTPTSLIPCYLRLFTTVRQRRVSNPQTGKEHDFWASVLDNGQSSKPAFVF